MLFQEDCRIIDNVKIAPDYYKITFESTNISKDAKPGQFVEIKISGSSTAAIHELPLLRRPFSFHKIGDGKFEVLYHVVGRGTRILSAINVRAQYIEPHQDTIHQSTPTHLNIIGPLGNGFNIIKDKAAVLIAGGCGSAPLYCLEEELKKQNIESHFFMGARTEDLLLCRTDLAKLGTKMYISTDDGSCGEKCNVAALYSSFISNLDKNNTVIYACGPNIMLQAVSEIAIENGIPCQLSLEENMACGIGACLGCVVNTKDGYMRVCKEGPVFDAKELLWK